MKSLKNIFSRFNVFKNSKTVNTKKKYSRKFKTGKKFHTRKFHTRKHKNNRKQFMRGG